jgi:membrane protein DedA with SNARE-associated domain
MPPNPYRTSAPHRADDELPRFLDLAPVAAITWLATLVRVGVALSRSEPASRELDIAWLLLLVLPLVIVAELRAARARR